MEAGTIQKTILIFQEAFQKLEIETSVDIVEDLAIVVDRALNLSARSFHTPEHVFKLASLPDPIQSLSALFHDVVYYQVDQGFSTEIDTIVAPYIRLENDNVFLAHQQDPLFSLALDVFDFRAGQAVSPFNGLNEFLSALVALKKLDGILMWEDLLRVAVCIEATIPFRGLSAQGQSYGEMMEVRVQGLNRKYAYGMNQAELEALIHLAILFSNKDVESFAEEDPGRFLDDTWKLLPESNVSLRDNQLYSIHQYRTALQKTEAFLWSLDQERIFKRYRNVPSERVYRELVQRSYQNLCIGREYLGVKLLSMAMLEALAELTGGDAPVALFMGETKLRSPNTDRLEDYLPNLPPAPNINTDSAIYRLLHTGRASNASFDLRNSPLSLFLYQGLGSKRLHELLEEAKRMFAGQQTHIEFLQKVDQPVAMAVARACASRATTRREAILELLAIL